MKNLIVVLEVISLIIISLFQVISTFEKEITVNIEPGKQDCFFQKVLTGQSIDIEYQVIDGGHGDLDISFHLIDPVGRILHTDFKKSENNHRVDAKQTGDFRFCFDNTFSSYNSKTVFFELIVEHDDEDSNIWGEEKIEGLRQEEVYELTVQEINESIHKVRNHISKVRQLQDIIKSTEARDRSVAEENFFKVNVFSSIQIGVMLTVGFIQVVMVRSLFDDRSRVHKLMKSLNSRR